MTNRRRRLTGMVISDKMQKTVVVRVDHSYRHPLYGKVVRTYKRYMAHDEYNTCVVGDTVVIVESRPLSRHKRWAVEAILREDISARTAEVSEVAEVEVEAAAEELAAVSADEYEEADVAEEAEDA